MRYYATLNNLGLYPASLFLYVEFQQYVSATLAGYKERICTVDDVTDYDMEGGLSFQTSSKSLPAAFWTVRDILVDFKSFFTDESVTNDLPIPIRLDWCTPKMRVLVDTLLAHHSPTFQGIVFVEQRQVAAVLAKILPAIPQLKGIIRSSSLIGQGVGLEGISKAVGSNQSDAVKQFRAGRINLRWCLCLSLQNMVLISS
jgi:endoribonuclease Dicer